MATWYAWQTVFLNTKRLLTSRRDWSATQWLENRMFHNIKTCNMKWFRNVNTLQKRKSRNKEINLITERK